MTEQEMQDIHDDYVKCGDIAQRLAALYPEHQGVWVGTISERLERLFSLMALEITNMRR